jgi:hypothetical protein
VPATKQSRKRCWSCNIEISPRDVECPDCGVGLNSAKRRRPSITEKKKRKKKKAREEARDNWRESLFGAFAYAFPAVLRDKGWLLCLWCAGVMTAAPIIPAVIGLLLFCIPFFGGLLYLCFMFVIIVAAPAGILSRNMEVASRFGARDTVQHWEMSLKDEMIPSSIELLKANLFLGLLPLLAAGIFATVFGSFTATALGSVQVVGQIGAWLTGLLYVGVALACTFCGPMCIMLLGAGDSSSAFYPPSVFKMLFRTLPQYLAFYAYIVLLVVGTFVLAFALGTLVVLAFGSVASVWDRGGMFSIMMMIMASLGSMFVVCLVATYFSAIVGWSMGIFIHRNYEHFEAIVASD